VHVLVMHGGCFSLSSLFLFSHIMHGVNMYNYISLSLSLTTRKGRPIHSAKFLYFFSF